MNLLALACRRGWHRWRYHGERWNRRICVDCLTRQHLISNEWRTP